MRVITWLSRLCHSLNLTRPALPIYAGRILISAGGILMILNNNLYSTADGADGDDHDDDDGDDDDNESGVTSGPAP